MSPFTSIPVIDIEGLARGSEAAIGQVAEQIRAACTDVGFFYIVNHGIEPAVIEAAMESSREFFHLPLEEKRKVAAGASHRGYNALGKALMDGAELPDFKEFFQVGLELPADDPDVLAGQPLRGSNLWPERPAAFRPAMSRYYDAIGEVGRVLLRGVAVSLGRPGDFFDSRYAKPLQRTQVVYYPRLTAAEGPDRFGVAPHSDFGCITLLYQDSSGGLEVQNLTGDWVAGPPLEGALVINVGDLLERWSNRHFVSTKHRVINRSGHERLSIATFFDPDYTALIDPAELWTDEAPLFEPTTAGDHIMGRIQRSFGYGAKKAEA
ncbi:Isopenicillin N synthase [Tistlia consotensis]|uniref:2-oxoglutarate-dependent ethylene/succinate-forming enzyme n=1 Tax=Tistlia consotensis USBA 355 TaxID=560819 RepID=A0A1Y6B927_9PROT|nr:2-oxoglutarate and iron-dependent oxygenase domain-containing protein [Tistlia consotensis]SME99238.1 Isopenicillin N synthase [Tistlia consotensis USBA 355]SNR77211.1 Isopenicillin N synthase [Tistlia consotensis]